MQQANSDPGMENVRDVNPPAAHSIFDISNPSSDTSAMLDLAMATRGQFEPCIGHTFDLPSLNGPIALTLTEVRPLGAARPGAAREPFALTFTGAPALRLPQQIRHLEHAALGTMEIFLVQTGADANASHFEAVFN